jgi:DNA-binding FadR family transcriptional regulator
MIPAKKPSRVGTQPVQIPKAASIIAEDFRRRIALGKLQPGDVLPSEAELMSSFSVSRPTLREAFRILEAESLIRVQRGARGGARIQQPSADVAAKTIGLLLQLRGATLAQVLDARLIIEPPLAAQLAQRRTQADLDTLRAHVARERVLIDDDAEFALATAEFHRILVELAGNTALAVIVGTLHEIFQRHVTQFVSRVRRYDPGDLARRASDNHARLVELIERRQSAGAEKHWRKHMQLVRDISVGELGGPTLLELY